MSLSVGKSRETDITVDEDFKAAVSTEQASNIEVPLGWRPGDPLPDQTMKVEPSSLLEEGKDGLAVAKSPAPPATPVPDPVKDADEDAQGFDFILNPDLDTVEDDESSDDFSEDEW